MARLSPIIVDHEGLLVPAITNLGRAADNWLSRWKPVSGRSFQFAVFSSQFSDRKRQGVATESSPPVAGLFSQLLLEAVEQVVAIVRSGRCFGVMLNAKRSGFFMSHTGDGIVV